MTSLPDRKRPRLPVPPRRLAARVVRLASAAAWRTLHPAAREPFVEAGRPEPLRRLYYRAADGWQAPLFCLPPSPGGAGEPVVLVHSAGAGHDAFRYGRDSLARALCDAGFSVYLLAHRGDRDAVPPDRGARARAGFSDTLAHDLPAALEVAATDAGYPRCHLVGHGLGGLLALAHGGRRGACLASVVALGAPLSLPDPPSEARRAALLLALAPRGLHVPMRAVLRAGLPLVDDSAHLAHHVAPGVSPAPRVRGALAWTGEDLPVALLRELSGWLRAGTPLLHGVVELRETLRDARVPLLAVVGSEDRICPEVAGAGAVCRWGHSDAAAHTVDGYGHLDLLWGRDAARVVFPEVVGWLEQRRRAAWHHDGVAQAG